MATLNREDIEKALTRLGELATSSASSVRLVLVGGGAMVLGFSAREATRDLDVAILEPVDHSFLRALSAEVAIEFGWPDSWLNDAAKGYLVGLSPGPVIFTSLGISVIRPGTEQLLAMKLCAWRDDVDVSDARRLLVELSGDRDEIWQRTKPFLQPGQELKAQYAFADLWEESHG